MNHKGTRIRLTVQNALEIMGYTNPELPSASGNHMERASGAGGLLTGRVEVLDPRPGLRICIAEYCAHEEIEILKDFDQTAFVTVLTVDGSWSRAIKDIRGGTAVLEGAPGLNLAAYGPPQEYMLRMRGGQFHRCIKVEISGPLLSELAAGTEMEGSELARLTTAPPRSRRILIRSRLSPALTCIAHQAIHCPMRAGARALFLESKAMEILAHQMEAHSVAPTGMRPLAEEGDLQRLQDARIILEAEFANPPSLCGLARRVGLNDFKLKRGFREVFGITVFGYVRRLRMDRARRLLEIERMSVTQAAFEAGYNSLGHFAAAFRKQFGILPSECRPGRSRR